MPRWLEQNLRIELQSLLEAALGRLNTAGAALKSSQLHVQLSAIRIQSDSLLYLLQGQIGLALYPVQF